MLVTELLESSLLSLCVIIDVVRTAITIVITAIDDMEWQTPRLTIGAGGHCNVVVSAALLHQAALHTALPKASKARVGVGVHTHTAIGSARGASGGQVACAAAAWVTVIGLLILGGRGCGAGYGTDVCGRERDRPTHNPHSCQTYNVQSCVWRDGVV